MTEKTLVMIFQNEGGNNVRISVDNVKDGLTDAEAAVAMQDILAKNIFETSAGDIVALVGAEIVTRSVQELNIA